MPKHLELNNYTPTAPRTRSPSASSPMFFSDTKTFVIFFRIKPHPLSKLIHRQNFTSLRVSFLNAGLAIPKELLVCLFEYLSLIDLILNLF